MLTHRRGSGGLVLVLTVVQRRLSNGLRTVVLPLPHLHQASCALMVKAGPRYETPSTNGLSHLVEHMVFRGTKRHRTSALLNAAIENLGGEINGLTQRDATTIHLTVPPASVLPGLMLLGEVCCEPRLDGLDIEREVVLEEILDTVDAAGFENDLDTLSRQALWAGHPLGMSVAGTTAHVERFTERQVRAHYRRMFVVENAVLVVAGPVDEPAVIATAERAFAKLKKGRALTEGPAPRPRERLPIQIVDSESAQASVSLSFPAPHENHPDYAALALLRRVLDDGLSSRLRQAVCEQRGLAYSVSATMDVYGDAGALDLDATCAPRKLVVTVAQMLSTLKHLVEEGISADELRRAQVREKAELEFGLDDPNELAFWHGSSVLMGCASGYTDRAREAQRVTVADVERVAASVFDPAKAVLTVVGPAHPSAVAKLEQMLGRPAGSSAWLNADEEVTPSVDDEVEPLEMLDLAHWAASKVRRDKRRATAAKRRAR